MGKPLGKLPECRTTEDEGKSFVYFDWESENVIPFPLDLHVKEIRRKIKPDTIAAWSRFYQVKDVIKRYKEELKATYAKIDDEARARAIELRKLLEDAVKDLDDYQQILHNARFPLDGIKK